jgi:hypothetical protein
MFKRMFSGTGKRGMETADLGIMKATTCKVNGNLIPRFDTLRWVPTRSRGILPLAVMKRYQCIVVGVTRSRLTVALAEGQEMMVPELLAALTGRTIFPVLIPQSRMRLLIKRLERAEDDRGNICRKKLLLHLLQIHSIVTFTASQWIQHK